MYYESRKNNYLGTFLIMIFLIAIIAILVNLINKIDSQSEIKEEPTLETGTEAIFNDFDIENLMKNSIYSVVRSIKIK